jgi:hypothetical protein
MIPAEPLVLALTEHAPVLEAVDLNWVTCSDPLVTTVSTVKEFVHPAPVALMLNVAFALAAMPMIASPEVTLAEVVAVSLVADVL